MSTVAVSRDASTRLLLTIRQVAESTGFCEKTIWAHTAPRGRLACVRVGRSVRYSALAVERWLAAQTVEAIPGSSADESPAAE